MVDALLISLSSCWLLFASVEVLSPEAQGRSGWSIRRLAEDIYWRKMTTAFKFTLLAGFSVHHLRNLLGRGARHSDTTLMSFARASGVFEDAFRGSFGHGLHSDSRQSLRAFRKVHLVAPWTTPEARSVARLTIPKVRHPQP